MSLTRAEIIAYNYGARAAGAGGQPTPFLRAHRSVPWLPLTGAELSARLALGTERFWRHALNGCQQQQSHGV